MLNPNLANNLSLNSIAEGGFGHSSVKLTTAFTDFQKTPNILVEQAVLFTPEMKLYPISYISIQGHDTLIFLLAVRNRALKWQA